MTAPAGSGPGAPLHRWLVVLGAWSGVAAFSVAQIWLARTALGHPPPLVPLLVLELPVWLLWAMLTVPIVMLARRFPLDRTQPAASVLLHGTAAIIFAVAAVGFQMLWYQAFNPYPLTSGTVGTWFWTYFRQHFVVGVMIYWATVGVYHAFTNYFTSRRRELETAQAREQLTEARLQALRAQIHPHFLFNTLNSISALIGEQPGEARRLIAELGDLLRASLRSDAPQLVPLEEEIRLVRRYLDIEQVRLGERLEVCLRVETDTLRATVPGFLLQPLVENAVRHGIARREAAGRIWLAAERLDGRLVLHVLDNGPGLQDGRTNGGIGLENTRRRLAGLYGDRQQLSLSSRPGGGTRVRVEIPFVLSEGEP